MVLTIIGAMFTFGEAYTSVMSAVAVRISYGEYRDNDYDCSGDNERCAKVSTTVDGMVYYSLTSHSTQYRSFRRRDGSPEQ